MGADGFSGGVIFAIAAVLWLVYLVPSWLRRGQYLATERNAVRLQQTLRIMAETAEVPEEIRIESAARVAAEQKRALRLAEAEALAESRTAADVAAKLRRVEAIQRAEALAAVRAAAAADAQAARAAQSQTAASVAYRRQSTMAVQPETSKAFAISREVRRRRRLANTLFLLAAVVGLVVGGALIASQGAWAVFLVSALSGAFAGFNLSRLAKVVVAESEATPVRRAQPAVIFDDFESDAVRQDEQFGWLPTPLPKPLYLSKGTVAASAMASIDAAAELRRAAEKSELDLRAAQMQPEVPTIAPAAKRSTAHASAPASTAESPSQFARMGVIDEASPGHIDLDAVLRRRRAG